MRGVSLEEISVATRIAPRFLEALENEQWEQLPGGVFNRGFIRSVARYLGLDEDNLVAEYALQTKGRPEPGVVAEPPDEPDRLWARVSVLVVLAILIIAAGWAAIHYLGPEDRRALAQTFRRSRIFCARASFVCGAGHRRGPKFHNAAAGRYRYIPRLGCSDSRKLPRERSLSLAPSFATRYVPAARGPNKNSPSARLPVLSPARTVPNSLRSWQRMPIPPSRNARTPQF